MPTLAQKLLIAFKFAYRGVLYDAEQNDAENRKKAKWRRIFFRLAMLPNFLNDAEYYFRQPMMPNFFFLSWRTLHNAVSLGLFTSTAMFCVSIIYVILEVDFVNDVTIVIDWSNQNLSDFVSDGV